MNKILREDVINHFTLKFSECRYLEIGSRSRDCFNKIKAITKHDCEPNPVNITPYFKGTSDDFFKQCGYSIYDVIFIDGLHQCDQVLKDIKNSSDHLSENGWILLHDCYPETKIAQLRELTNENCGCWNGDCYKAIAYLIKYFRDQINTIVDTDQGFCIIKGNIPYFNMPSLEELCDITWEQYLKNRNFLLNCTTWNEFIK